MRRLFQADNHSRPEISMKQIQVTKYEREFGNQFGFRTVASVRSFEAVKMAANKILGNYLVYMSTRVLSGDIYAIPDMIRIEHLQRIFMLIARYSKSASEQGMLHDELAKQIAGVYEAEYFDFLKPTRVPGA